MDETKEVYFDQYCHKCKYKDLAENEHPCYECLAVPARCNSHCPERFVRDVRLNSADKCTVKVATKKGVKRK